MSLGVRGGVLAREGRRAKDRTVGERDECARNLRFFADEYFGILILDVYLRN